MNNVADTLSQDWVKTVLAALLSAALTSLGWYVSIVGDMVTMKEATAIVQTQAPYLEDRKHLIATLSALQQTTSRNQETITKLRVEISRLNATIRSLERSIDSTLGKGP